MDAITEKHTLEELNLRMERIMHALPPENLQANTFYLAGVVDTLFECDEITQEQHDSLYMDYAE